MTDEQKFAIDRSQRAIKELNQAVISAKGVGVTVSLSHFTEAGSHKISATCAFEDLRDSALKPTFD